MNLEEFLRPLCPHGVLSRIAQGVQAQFLMEGRHPVESRSGKILTALHVACGVQGESIRSTKSLCLMVHVADLWRSLHHLNFSRYSETLTFRKVLRELM